MSEFVRWVVGDEKFAVFHTYASPNKYFMITRERDREREIERIRERKKERGRKKRPLSNEGNQGSSLNRRVMNTIGK